MKHVGLCTHLGDNTHGNGNESLVAHDKATCAVEDNIGLEGTRKDGGKCGKKDAGQRRS